MGITKCGMIRAGYPRHRNSRVLMADCLGDSLVSTSRLMESARYGKKVHRFDLFFYPSSLSELCPA